MEQKACVEPCSWKGALQSNFSNEPTLNPSLYVNDTSAPRDVLGGLYGRHSPLTPTETWQLTGVSIRMWCKQK